MARSRIDPVYEQMREAVSSKCGINDLPAFLAVLESVSYWLKFDFKTKQPHCRIFVQLVFNKDNYGKNCKALEKSIYYEQQTIRKNWNIYKKHFLRDYAKYKALPTQLLITSYIQFVFDRDICIAIFPHRILTLVELLTFLDEAVLSTSDKKFYERIIQSRSESFRSLTFEELYNEVAVSKDE